MNVIFFIKIPFYNLRIKKKFILIKVDNELKKINDLIPTFSNSQLRAIVLRAYV